MFKDYYAAREWLESFIPLVWGKEELGLVRIEYFLKLLGNPEKKFKSIHVAGTSGKGSTAFYIAKLLEISGPVSSFLPTSARSDQNSNRDKKDNHELRAGGNPSRTATRNFKVGLHISPHLVDIRERMQIFTSGKLTLRQSSGQEVESGELDSSFISMGRFLKLFKQVRPVVEKIQKERSELTPSYFEILVAATFKYFAEEKVDWAVVEVGLGGRLDATNVLQSRIAVITNIGLDHTDILGNTIEKIAFEKAGIIKTGIPVVTGARGEALKVIEKVAKEKGAKVYRVESRESREGNFELAEKTVEVALDLSNKSIRKHLSKTSADAKALVDRQGSTLSISNLSFPGRFEEIDEGPTSPKGLRGVNVILDGAHNPDKIKSLIHFVRKSFFLRHSRVNENPDPRAFDVAQRDLFESERPQSRRPEYHRMGRLREDDSMVDDVVLVLAFKKGKDWQKMVDLLVKNLSVKKVIATEFQAVTDTGLFGTVPAEEIANYIDSRFKIQDLRIIKNSQEAVFEALQSTARPASRAKRVNCQLSTVIVTGSLYLVGEVRTIWELPEW